MELKEKFEQAVLQSKMLSAKPSNEILLQLYSLYKQSMQGDVDVPPPANPFDIVAAAKHQAWSSLKGLQQEEAMEQYIALVDRLRS